MIRTVLGFLLVYGAVGALDSDPTFPMADAVIIAAIGLFTMYFGVKAVQERA
jgi:hypothetical protein